MGAVFDRFGALLGTLGGGGFGLENGCFGLPPRDLENGRKRLENRSPGPPLGGGCLGLENGAKTAPKKMW